MTFPPEFEAQFKDVDLPEFPGPMVYDTRKMASGGVIQEFGELKQPEIIGWTDLLGGGARPVYAVPGFLRDPTYYARKDRRDHIITSLEMRWLLAAKRPITGWRARKTIRAAIQRVYDRPV